MKRVRFKTNTNGLFFFDWSLLVCTKYCMTVVHRIEIKFSLITTTRMMMMIISINDDDNDDNNR